MTQRTIHLGESPLAGPSGPVAGRLLDLQGDRFYAVENVQRMQPFLLSVVSDSDHWLFAASNGALTAGRRSPATALFPYVTEDRVLDSVGVSGPVTALLADVGGRRQLWRPLRGDDPLVYRVVRRLYKNVLGNRLILEEENLDLRLTFRAAWSTSHAYGFVRECEVVNGGADPVELEALDGLLNVLPAEVDDAFQNAFSVLIDAYKRSEQVPGTSLAVFALQAQVTDRPVPREALRATTVWSHGLDAARVLLDAAAVERFERGLPLEEGERRGLRGAYLLAGRAGIGPGAAARWQVVADVSRTQHQVAALAAELAEPVRAVERVRLDVARGRERLLRIVAATDGLQATGDELATAHHVANVLFNDMRGGVPAAGGAVSGLDLAAFVSRMSPATAARQRDFLASLGEREQRAAVLARVEALGDPDLSRLALEYLPLTFSRRHGDPSRPWNRFDIQVRDEQGEELLAYQGNWRDIFQNWEALARSLPELLEGIIAQVRQRLHRRRLQPVPHHQRRHRLGGARAQPPLGRHRVLGRSPAGVPPEPGRAVAAPPPGPSPGAAATATVHLRRRALPDRALRRDPSPPALDHPLRRGQAPRHPGAPGARGRAMARLLRGRRRSPPSNPGGKAPGAGAGQARQPRAGRRRLDEHPAAGVERRQQRAGGERPLGGDALPPGRLPAHAAGTPGRAARRAGGPVA